MSAGYKVGPEVLNGLPSLRYLFDGSPVRPPTPEEQALYEQRCAVGGDLHDLVVLAEAPADLPGPAAATRAPLTAPSEGRAGEPQTPDREVEDEGRDGGADV
jgi:hypothetical protein